MNNRPKVSIYFKLIDYGREDYKKAVILREEILRKPLGLSFTKEELELEKEHVHVAGFLGEELCATAVLVPDQSALKMQRVAIKTTFQGKGIGSALVTFCEEYARRHGCQTIYCYAKEVAIPFYLKNQYLLSGEICTEDGTSHCKKMKKII